MSEDLEAKFGPQWQAVVNLVERCKILTPVEVERLAVARGAAWYAVRGAVRGAARGAALDAARYAAWSAARDAALDAVRGAAWDAARDAALSAARDAARDAARSAALAVVTYDLAKSGTSYTPEHRDLLLAPWVEVCGCVPGIVGEENPVTPAEKSDSDTVEFLCRMPRSLRDALKYQADKEDRNMAGIVRLAIKEYLTNV